MHDYITPLLTWIDSIVYVSEEHVYLKGNKKQGLRPKVQREEIGAQGVPWLAIHDQRCRMYPSMLPGLSPAKVARPKDFHSLLPHKAC